MPYPLTYWTLEYRPVGPATAGTEQTLAAWGIQNMELSYESQQIDECSFTIAGSNMDDALLFNYKTICVIRSGRTQASPTSAFTGGRTEFFGLVIQTPRDARGRSEQV